MLQAKGLRDTIPEKYAVAIFKIKVETKADVRVPGMSITAVLRPVPPRPLHIVPGPEKLQNLEGKVDFEIKHWHLDPS